MTVLTQGRQHQARRTVPWSLPVNEWPQADRDAWEAACRLGSRLKPGGAASRLAPVSRNDYANRYGAFLGFLERTGRLDHHTTAAAHVTLANVEDYLTDLRGRVRSVTIYNCISMLRRTARLLAPAMDYSWLLEIENDLKLEMHPRSKLDRLVFTGQLVKAGLALMLEARQSAKTHFDRARGLRNGLMIALLGLCPIRIKNFAALELDRTFKKVGDSWWITLPATDTKTTRPDERRVPIWLSPYVEMYLDEARPVLCGSKSPQTTLWVSSTTGRRMTANNMGTLISRLTLKTLGVSVSPHLFRTAAASTAAAYGSATPHLASALLSHRDPRITEEHYNRAGSANATIAYAEITRTLAD